MWVPCYMVKTGPFHSTINEDAAGAGASNDGGFIYSMANFFLDDHMTRHLDSIASFKQQPSIHALLLLPIFKLYLLSSFIHCQSSHILLTFVTVCATQ